MKLIIGILISIKIVDTRSYYNIASNTDEFRMSHKWTSIYIVFYNFSIFLYIVFLFNFGVFHSS